MPVYILCSDMMSCMKDSSWVANSVNIDQNALDGMVWSKLALYAQKICCLLHSVSDDLRASDDITNE